MKRKVDPIFGVEALRKLDDQIKTRVKPYQKLRTGPRKLKLCWTKLYSDQMRYLYGTDKE